MGSVFGLGGLLLMPVLALTGAPLLASWTNAAVGAYMALVPMFAGYLLFGWGLARIQASTATGISLLETVVAAVLAVLVVGERRTARGWLGAAVVLGSLFILSPRSQHRRRVNSAGGLLASVPARDGAVQQEARTQRQQQETHHYGDHLLAADARRYDREREQANKLPGDEPGRDAAGGVTGEQLHGQMGIVRDQSQLQLLEQPPLFFGHWHCMPLDSMRRGYRY